MLALIRVLVSCMILLLLLLNIYPIDATSAHYLPGSGISKSITTTRHDQPQHQDHLHSHHHKLHRPRTVNNAGSLITVATDKQCPEPINVYVDPQTGNIYATCYGGDVIRVIPEHGSMNVTTVTTQCATPFGLYVDSTTGTVYVTCLHGGVMSISNTGTEVQIFNSTQCTNAADIYEFNHQLYIACEQGIMMYDIATTKTTALVSTQDCPTAERVSVSDVTGLIYASCGDRILQIDTSSGKPSITKLTDTAQCPDPNGVAVGPIIDNIEMIYAICFHAEAGGVISIHNSTITHLTTTSQCMQPCSVEYSSVTKLVYATCYESVISVDPNNEQVTSLTQFKQCPIPSGLFVDQQAHIYTTCLFPNPQAIVEIQP